MNRSLFNLLLRWLILALGVALAARLISGISYDNGVTLLIVALLLGFCNAVLRPILVLFTDPGRCNVSRETSKNSFYMKT